MCSILYKYFAFFCTSSPPGRIPSSSIPRSMASFIVCHTFARYSQIYSPSTSWTYCQSRYFFSLQYALMSENVLNSYTIGSFAAELPSNSILPPPTLSTRAKSTCSPFLYANISIVLGWSMSVLSKLNSTVVLIGANVFSITVSVQCPLPVLASEPYKITLNSSASAFFSLKITQAFSGPIVCELDGPQPIL